MEQIIFYKVIPFREFLFGLVIFIVGIVCVVSGLHMIVCYARQYHNPAWKKLLIITETHLITPENPEPILWQAIAKIHLEHYNTQEGKARTRHRTLYFCTERYVWHGTYRNKSSSYGYAIDTRYLGMSDLEFFTEVRKFYGGLIIKEYQEDLFHLLEQVADGQYAWVDSMSGRKLDSCLAQLTVPRFLGKRCK